MEFEHYEINRIERPFKYVLSMYPIDDFSFTLTKEQVVDNVKEFMRLIYGKNNTSIWGDDTFSDDEVPTDWPIGEYKINGFDSMDELEKYVSEYVEVIENDKPHTIRYIGIPPVKNANIPEIVAIAKVSKRGTTYVFSNNKNFLKFLNT